MGFFDSLKRKAENTVKKEVSNAVSDVKSAVSDITGAIGKGSNRSEKFTFNSIPQNVSELKELPEASLDSAFKTAALTVLVLCRYKESPEDAFEMLDHLKGPEQVSNYEKQFIKERLYEKEYVPFSYFEGATPQNGYTPALPMTIEICENPYSFDNEHWATLWVKSGGADNPRSIKFRQKPSTGEWFLNDIQCLSEIRLPADKDPWA